MSAPYMLGSTVLTTATAQTVVLPSIAPQNVAGQTSPLTNAGPVAGSLGTITPAKTACATVFNPSGSGATVTAGALVFSDVASGITASVSYALSTPSIAPGAASTFYFALSNGILANVKLSLTFGTNPTAGGTLSAIVSLLPN